MPKNTFHNLPKEKKERILNAAINEFAQYFYHKASINRIVNNADIAKGSFYQYFDDKKDLFKYVVEIIGEKKMKYLNESLKELHQLEFFKVVRGLYISAIKFTKENPKLAAIGNNFIKSNDSFLKEEILGESIPKSNEFFEELLKKGIERGEIDSEVDVKLVSYLITTLSISISEYYFNELDEKDEGEIMPFIDRMLYILENGIKKKKGGY